MAEPPNWLQEFVNRVTTSINGVDVLAPLGCHFHFADAAWEVTLFCAMTEIVGGPQDGEMRLCSFRTDLAMVARQFDRLDSMNWVNGPEHADDLGAHVSVTGVVESHFVWLRILSSPPPKYRQTPGRVARVTERRWEEIW